MIQGSHFWSSEPSAGCDHPCRAVFVQVHTGLPSLCLWHSSKWLCHQFADCSVLRKLGSWRCPCWCSVWIWELNYNLCFHYIPLFPSTPDPFLEAGEPSVHHSWLMRTQRQCMWWTGSVRAAPGQVLTPSAAPGTGHLGTSNVNISHTSASCHVWVPLLKPWTLTAWKGQQAEEQHQDSHALMEALMRRGWGSSARPGLSAWAWGLLCIGGGSWEDKRKHWARFLFFPQVREICLVLSRATGEENKEQFSGTDWSSNYTWTRSFRIHTV